MEKFLHPQPHPFLPEENLSPALAPDPSHTGPRKPSAQTTPLHSPHWTHTQPLRARRAQGQVPESSGKEAPAQPSFGPVLLRKSPHFLQPCLIFHGGGTVCLLL
ncbi:hypothetical protein H8959_001356 [Pygathrix nigripes]